MPARRSADCSRFLAQQFLWLFLLPALALGVAWAQDSPAAPQAPAAASQPASTPSAKQPAASGTPAPAAQPPASSQSSTAGSGVSVEQQSSPPPAKPQTPKAAEQPAAPITKQQAKELFRSVDKILQFASDDTGLPIRHSVKRKLITREAIANYLQKHMREDKDTQRVERSQAVLIKFGLLPPNYDLQSEYLRLLGEQVAAFYDAKTKTVNLLDWVPPDQQKPVLAHELTHALQDQKVGLEKWQLAGAKDDSLLPDNEEEVVEEEQAAREAVTEGQAMIVFLDYSLAPLGVNVLKAPQVVDAMRSEMGASDDSPLFSAAPIFLRESLLFPYTFGSDFVRDVLSHKGKDAAFAGMLDKPPVSTRQVMEPDTYLKDETVPPLKIPDLDKLVGPAYERYDFGGMGEFDIYLLMKQYAPDKDAKAVYSHWRGGYYLAVHAKNAPKNQIALLYLSRWDTSDAAQSFAAVYEKYTPNRYPQWMKDPSAVPSGAGGIAISKWWEGPPSERVEVLQHGGDLLILEGFDESTAGRLQQALLPSGSPEEANPSPAAGNSSNPKQW